ncbi:hypothetical protein AURDEDRAFT_160996 [Auricularia subglabra TFB-10046 SS5]|nr:hypothetical protein AURDEDRAFT_160996 [Auricularia subglabra TFB-10046 SS5]
MPQHDFYTPCVQLQALLDAGDLVRATWAVVGVWEQSAGRQPSYVFEQLLKTKNPFVGYKIEQEVGDRGPRFLWRVRGGLHVAAPSKRGLPICERAAPLAARSDGEVGVAGVLLDFAAHSRIHLPSITTNANGWIRQSSREEADVAQILLDFADNVRIHGAAAGNKMAAEEPEPRTLLGVNCCAPASVAQLAAASNTSAATPSNGAGPSTGKRAREEDGEAIDHEQPAPKKPSRQSLLVGDMPSVSYTLGRHPVPGRQVAVLLEILRRWCKASGATFNIPVIKIIPLDPEQYKAEPTDGRHLNGADVRIDQNVRIDGKPTRVLGS